MNLFLTRLASILACANAFGDPGQTNIAAGKTPTASTTYTGNPPSQVTDGNDGNRNGGYFAGLSVFHSAIPDAVPGFWEVDLGATYHLDRVMIWPRTDVAQNTVENFRITVRDAANTVVWQQSYLPAAATNFAWGSSAMRGVQGRKVRFERLDSTPNFTSFAEFEVWGGLQAPPVNLALNKPATGSPPAFSTTVARGNDGVLDGSHALPGNPIYHSAATAAGQFWEVDLGSDRQLDYVTLFNRSDFVTTTELRLRVRNAAGTETYMTTIADISRAVIVNGGAQFDITHDIPGVVTGRFVRLETTLAQYLAFTELEVFGPVADTFAPAVSAVDPPAGTLLAELLTTEVVFSEDVLGVNASDLLVNGAPAAGVTALSARRFAFTFPQPANGLVNFTWSAGHGIGDASANAFAGAGWSVTLNTSLPPPQPVISEFMADNEGGLRDADGDSSDWLEIYNPGPTPANLNGWFLSDSAAVLNKWRIPATTVAAGARLIVFASGKDRALSGAELHTNFKLKSEGGFLALVKPDGTTIASAWSYPNQRANRSYGLGRSLSATPLVAQGALMKWLVPAGVISGWEARAFDDSGWSDGTSGLGFDQNTGGGGLLGYWDFNDAANPTSAADASGNGYAGALTSATFTADAGGRTSAPGDRALSLGGVGLMNVGAAAGGAFDSSASNDAITLSLWINGAGSQPQPDFLFFAGSLNTGGGSRVLGAHVPWSDSIIYWDTVACCDPALNRIFVGDPNPAHWRGQWNHYAFIKRGDTKEIWQNGALIHSGLNTADMVPFRSLYLGASSAAGANGYDGMIDDFVVWDGALSPSEISALYAGGSPLDARKLTPLIATDTAAQMRNVNASVYSRIHFNVADPAALNQLVLRLNYDDGFICHLNGVEVARRNAPAGATFNSPSSVARPGGSALTAEEIDISGFAGLLTSGDNVLAFQGMNSSAGDGEFLLLPELLGGSALAGRYFTIASPGAANGAGYSGFTADTIFAPKRGFYDSAQTVTITCATAGATIAYTTDGSDPSPVNGTQTASPAVVNVSTTTTLRAVAFAADLSPTNVDTHTFLFPDHVAAQARPPTLGPTWPSGHPSDFEMDPRVYAGAQPGYSVREGLLAIPTLAVTVAPDGLWSASNGIYANSGGRGSTYERAAHAEYMIPGQPLAGFQIRFGLRIHGNISRDKGFTPKHSFKMFFRGDYGDAKLDYDIFGGGVDKFDQFILRGGSTDTWPVTEWAQVGIGPGGSPAYRWLRPWASYVRDQWVRNAGNAMGQPNARGSFVHLYLNGIYWGIYNLAEHPDDDFCADTIGGKPSDWDTLKDFAEIESGDMTAWNQLISLASGGLTTNAAYFRLLGQNADGTPNAAFNVLLNEQSLIDYMLLHIFIGADDWPNHNWWAGRRSRGSVTNEGFRFIAWDQEISNENHTYTKSSWGYVYQDANAANTPTQVYFAARSNPEFRIRFADRIHKHLFNGGALTQAANVARWSALTAGIDKAIVAESARWGDYQRAAQPYVRESEWLSHLAFMNGTYWPNINGAALSRFSAAGLWPATIAPGFSQFGGAIAIDAQLSITNPNGGGTVHYTLDGTDPRVIGGGVAPGALTYSAPFTVGQPRTVRARVRSTAGVWSAMTDAAYTIIPDSDNDGLGDAWELANGFTIGPDESAQDTDGDSHSNLLEYRAGTDPRVNSSSLQFESIASHAGIVTFIFTARANRAYTLQRSLDLESWTNVVTHPAEPSDHTVVFTDPAVGTQQFYRLEPKVP
jgi:CotH kinase protein/Concanavalin A-like lectin/glucanases superfamily/Lamin Tail Domain/Chitobiase/beta-hexosaminidase C-terminal domain